MSSYIRVSGGLALALVLVVAGVALRISGGGPLPIDSTIMSATTRFHTPHRTLVVDVATQAFSPWAIVVWTALAAVILLVRDACVLRAVMLVAAVASAGALCAMLKMLAARPRPPVADQVGVLETTYSFPSGHVAGTAALVAVASLVARSAGGGARTALWVCAIVAVVFVCATRLYLGVHWISDVVAAVGVACAATLLVLPIVELAVAKWPSRRRSVLIVAILLVLSAVAVILAVDGDGISDGASAARQAGHLAGVWATEYAEWFSAHH